MILTLKTKADDKKFRERWPLYHVKFVGKLPDPNQRYLGDIWLMPEDFPLKFESQPSTQPDFSYSEFEVIGIVWSNGNFTKEWLQKRS